MIPGFGRSEVVIIYPYHIYIYDMIPYYQIIPYLYHIVISYIYIFMCCVGCCFGTHDIPYDIASLETQAAGKSAITWRFRGRLMGDQSSNGTTIYWFHLFGMMPFVATVQILSHTRMYTHTHTHIYIYIYTYTSLYYLFRLVYILSNLSETKKTQNVVQTSYWSILYLTYLDPLKSMAESLEQLKDRLSLLPSRLKHARFPE